MAGRAVSSLFGGLASALQNGVSRSMKGLKGELITIEFERMVYDFKEDKADEKWITVSDEEFGGKSEVAFEKSKHGQCVFKGRISTTLPEDGGKAKYSGFCAARSIPMTVTIEQFACSSFFQSSYSMLFNLKVADIVIDVRFCRI